VPQPEPYWKLSLVGISIRQVVSRNFGCSWHPLSLMLSFQHIQRAGVRFDKRGSVALTLRDDVWILNMRYWQTFHKTLPVYPVRISE
jgi:hypothetical protein